LCATKNAVYSEYHFLTAEGFFFKPGFATKTSPSYTRKIGDVPALQFKKNQN